MTNKILISLFLFTILSISFASEVTRLSQAERLKQLEQKLDQELKKHPELKQKIVTREFQLLYDTNLRYQIQKIYSHNITSKLKYDTAALKLSKPIVLLYDRQFNHLVRDLTHLVNKKVWRQVHKSLRQNVTKFLSAQLNKTYNNSNLLFIKELIKGSTARSLSTIKQVRNLVVTHTDKAKFRKNVVSNVSSIVVGLLEQYANGKVKDVIAELKKQIKTYNVTQQKTKQQQELLLKKKLAQKAQHLKINQGLAKNAISKFQIVNLALNYFFAENNLKKIHKKLKVYVPVFSLIKLGVQFIASKHLTAKQQQNISHGLKLLNRVHMEQVFQKIRGDSRVVKLQAKAQSTLSDIKFTGAKQLVAALNKVVQSAQSNSIYQVKILDHINDISDDDVNSINLKQKLNVPQSLKEVQLKLVDEVKQHESENANLRQGIKLGSNNGKLIQQQIQPKNTFLRQAQATEQPKYKP